MVMNMGTTDRLIRILVSVVIAVLYFTGVISGTLGLVLLIVSGILLLTGLVGVCPLYLPFRLSTRRNVK
ncbi:MAG TPA: DUF2892 domain-containing protein [Bacteroidales bacterium]|nr:DUF2892 domain-containing protein [Bacteroidales bacterium]